MNVRMLHTAEGVTCPIINEQGNYHFQMICEDCDVKYRLANATKGEVHDLYHQGRVTQDEFEAYDLVWDLKYPENDPSQVLISGFPDVRRIARKIMRLRGFDIPETLAPHSDLHDTLPGFGDES